MSDRTRNPGLERMNAPKRELREARLEDAAWMAETGEGLTGAANRLGITRDTLEKYLDRHAPHICKRLRAQEPRDHNSAYSATGHGLYELADRHKKPRKSKSTAA